MAHKRLDEILTKIEPFEREKKDKKQQLLQELEANDKEHNKETQNFVFSLKYVQPKQPLNKKFIEKSMQKYNAKHDAQIPDDFVAFLEAEQTKVSEKLPQKPRLQTKRKRAENS